MAPLEAGRVADHGGSLDRARSLFPARAGAVDRPVDRDQPALLSAFRAARHGADAAAGAGARRASSRQSRPQPMARRRRANVVAAPGTQILLPLVASLVKPGRAAVLAPTYAEHARAAALAGHAVVEMRRLRRSWPTRPRRRRQPEQSGRPHRRAQPTARSRRDFGAAADCWSSTRRSWMSARGESLGGDVGEEGIVVLKSFGKFFGLAGVRLGFAIAAPNSPTARRSARPVGGLRAGARIRAEGLADTGWQEAMRARLRPRRQRLDALLLAHGVAGRRRYRAVPLRRASGRGALFSTARRTRHPRAQFRRLPNCLRFGLPAARREPLGAGSADQALTAAGSEKRDVQGDDHVCPLSRIEETVALSGAGAW